ncbi:MAG: hypothetical protein JW728_04515 [Candidatus Aureabacteria bacterium]|nr:hypothetical protein [Candidatus Auribacterota bacterium]
MKKRLLYIFCSILIIILILLFSIRVSPFKEDASITPKKMSLASYMLSKANYFFDEINAVPQNVFIETKNERSGMIVNNNPFFIKGLCYSPIPVGQDGSYDFYRDPNRPWTIDGPMMENMGVNTIRLYKPSPFPEATKQVIRYFYKKHGIMSIMGHYLGLWNSPNYGDKEFTDAIKTDVIAMVKEYKDEPGILFWLLGNETNISFGYEEINPWSTPEIDEIKNPYERRIAKAKLFYSFVNDIAKAIKEIDPNHPVALGNSDSTFLEIAKDVTPDIDLVASNVYRGKTFGNFFRQVKLKYDKPVAVVEFGCDAYDAHKANEDQDTQALFISSQIKDLIENSYYGTGIGNCLGGCVFEWTDEWWKYNDGGYDTQDETGSWSKGEYYKDIEAPGNMNMNEEWWGINSLSDKNELGVEKRIPRKIYYEIKALYTQDLLPKNVKEENLQE